VLRILRQLANVMPSDRAGFGATGTLVIFGKTYVDIWRDVPLWLSRNTE